MLRLPGGPRRDTQNMQNTQWNVMKRVLDTSSVENLMGSFHGDVSCKAPMHTDGHANV